MPSESVEGAEGRAGRVPRAHQGLRAAADGVSVHQGVRELGREFGRDVGQVLLGRHHARRVVHLDLQVGQRVQKRGVSHGDFVGHVVEGVNGTSVHGSGRRQVRRSC